MNEPLVVDSSAFIALRRGPVERMLPLDPEPGRKLLEAEQAYPCF